MLRTLLRKEWKQLRSLRWVGLGLGLAVLLVALGAPSAARQGWLPVADTARQYTAAEILIHALPVAFAFGLWPLVALLMAVQAYAGDRSTGTESFLLERPVPRASIWVARLVASLASVMMVAGGHVAVWWIFVQTGIGAKPDELTRALAILGGFGLLAMVCCVLAGMTAASLLSSPMAALLLGIVLIAIPLQLAATLVGAFPLAAYRGVMIGLLAPVFLLVAYPVASYVALCRGEPAGRGRIKRGVVTLAVALVAAFGLFVVSAVAAIRLSAIRLPSGAQLVASPAGASVFASADTGGWIVDHSDAEARRFLPGRIWRAAWNADGSVLAVITFSGPLGNQTSMERLRFFDPEGKEMGKGLRLEETDFVNTVHWARDRLILAKMSRKGLSRIVTYSPETGETTTIPFKMHSWGWSIVGPTEDGRVFLAYSDVGVEKDEKTAGEQKGVSYGLHRIDLDGGEIEAEPLLRDHGYPYSWFSRLSPSGRFWFLDRAEPMGVAATILEIETGEETVVNGVQRSARWMKGDALAWITKDDDRASLMTGAVPGAEPTTLRTWTGLRVDIDVSPDLSAVLVTVTDVIKEQQFAAYPDRPAAIRSRVAESLVYDLDSGRWIELDTWPDETYDGFTYRTTWAGPGTIARTGPGVLAFESLDDPGNLRSFIGPTDP